MENYKKRILKKFYIDEYIVKSPYYQNNSKKIMVISDIHFHSHVNKNIFNLLIDKTKNTKPDFILLPGDLYETLNFIKQEKERSFFENFIKQLGEVAPVIIVPGNHEVGKFDSLKNHFKMAEQKVYFYSEQAKEYVESLNLLPNVHVLINNQLEIDGINFLGFSPRLNTYFKIGDPETNKMFIEDYLKSSFKILKDKYNVLLVHSPLLLREKMVIEAIEDFRDGIDLVVSGHLHDGYLPKRFDKKYGKTDVGLFFTPLVKPKPGLICRGMHRFSRGYIFVSQGFRKWTDDNIFFNSLERRTANDVEIITITNGSKLSEEKI